MKQFFTSKFHKEMMAALFSARAGKLYYEEREPKEIFVQGLKFFFYTYFVYAFVYVLLFILGFSYFSNLNAIMKADFEKKGLSSVSYLLNSYPFNVLYILASLLLFILIIAGLSYGLTRLLEDGKRSFTAHLGICMHASSLLLVSLFVILIANTIFPYDKTVGVVFFSILVAIWIIMFGIGVFFSTRVYLRASHSYFGQHKRRAAICWVLPFLLIVNTIFGIVTGI